LSAAKPLPLPVGVGEITLNWLQTVLDVPVTGFDSEVIGVGEGFSSALARLRLSYGDHGPTGPASVVVKFAAADEAVRDILDAFGGYTRECRFYAELGSTTPVALPHVYFTRIEPDGTNVIVMEDLTDGWVGDQVAGAGVEETKALFEQLATMHAQWWNSPALAAMDWVQPLEASLSRERLKADYTRGLVTLREEFADRFPLMVECAELIIPLLDEEFPQPRPFTLTQGDCRHDNAFYRRSHGALQAIVFDWQMVGMSGPVSDVARWLSQSVDIEIRRSYEDELLRYYLQALERAGVKHPLWRFRLEYRLEMSRQLVSWVIANEILDFEGTSERANTLKQAVLERLHAALLDHNVRGLLRVGAWIMRGLNLLGKILPKSKAA
jgi:hypothetical protein